MPTDTDWDRAVEKLTRKTESAEIVWGPHPQAAALRDGVEGNVYTTSVEGRYLAIFEYRYKEYVGTAIGAEDYEWEKEVAIEFVEHDGTLEWRWPQTANAWSLLDAVRCQNARGPEFIKRFLADENAVS